MLFIGSNIEDYISAVSRAELRIRSAIQSAIGDAASEEHVLKSLNGWNTSDIVNIITGKLNIIIECWGLQKWYCCK